MHRGESCSFLVAPIAWQADANERNWAAGMDANVVFGPSNRSHLEAMGIDADKYSDSLTEMYGDDALIFDHLVREFKGPYLARSPQVDDFSDFCGRRCVLSESRYFDQLFDMYNYLIAYNRGGKFGLYKFRQPEWCGPQVVLSRADFRGVDFSDLLDGAEIYRGMSRVEFVSGEFGQSWTTDIEVAKRFAHGTYEDVQDGMVASAGLPLKSVVYYDKNDNENEVIVELGSITSAREV